MKKVLSPISDTKMSAKAAEKPEVPRNLRMASMDPVEKYNAPSATTAAPINPPITIFCGVVLEGSGLHGRGCESMAGMVFQFLSTPWSGIQRVPIGTRCENLAVF